jgi:XTP/dITP diphosphohydrolase
MDKLLRELAETKSNNRAAHFSCVIVLAQPDGTYKTFEGRVDGNIAQQKSGNAGFGYDPIFIPTGFTHSFAEFNSAEKNKISHRGRALQKFISYLTQNTKD